MRIHSHISRKRFLYFFQIILYLLCDIEGIDIGLFGNSQNYGRLGILRGMSHFHCTSYNYFRHIRNHYRGTVVPFDECITQFFQVIRACHSTQGILVAIVTNNTTCRICTESLTDFFQFVHGDTISIHFLRIGQYLVLLIVAADNRHLRYTTRSQNGGFHHPIRYRAQLHH